MPRIPSLLPALALAGVAALPAAAQTIIPHVPRSATPTFAVEGNVSYSTLRGSDYRGTSDGVGFDAQALLGVDAFAIGAGFMRTTHDSPASSDIVLQGLFLEPRVALPFAYANFTPYLTARLARLEERRDVVGGRQEANGTSLGGGAGVLVRLLPSVQLNMALTYNAVRLGTAELNGQSVPGSRTSGQSLGFRAGLSLGFGEWGVR